MSHLTLSERVTIENALRALKGFKDIARLIGHSHTTVKREVVKHAQTSEKGAKGRVTNRCRHRLAVKSFYRHEPFYNFVMVKLTADEGECALEFRNQLECDRSEINWELTVK